MDRYSTPLSPTTTPSLAPDAAGAAGAAVAARPTSQVSPSSRGWMSAVDVRDAFVRFFEERDHLHVPSSPLVPLNDPTVLLTTAGMQQMTPYFMGLEQPPAIRMCSVQKCFRTVDIEEVGDESHCTFFFMLGNFSVGDYFKSQSLRWSWEFFTETMGLPADRLYPTVHPDDDDSFAIWRDEIGVPIERIGTLSDNWWGPVGDSGPNGPDSEIYFDLGEAFDDGSGTGVGDRPRYLEVWNNVFMEFFQSPDGSRTPLPRQNVDTGMGLERLAMVMQGASSIYDTDLYQPIIQRAAALAGVNYGHDRELDSALRVIGDHSRGGTFLISDGVLPSNEGRGYVLRRILRRAIRAGRRLGIERPFLAEMAGMVIDQFGRDYPSLSQRRSQIERVLTHEEESFGRTLSAGISRFQVLVDGLRGSGSSVVPGDEVFRLYDTFGFPYDLTVELAREQGLDVDQAGYESAMTAQREASRGGAMFKDVSRDRAELYVSALDGEKTTFVGYDPDVIAVESRVLALIGPEGGVDTAEAGQPVEIILDQTPFYAESGGQVGDSGELRSETGLVAIEDTLRPLPDVTIHRGIVREGFIRSGESVTASIDASRRNAIKRNHTATHLLHKALRLVLGDETHQAGSLVAPDRLRFDFTSLDAVRSEQLEQVQNIANTEVIEDTHVGTAILPYDEAVAQGAMALFGEKYGDVVRMVTVGDYSRELCGGTHVVSTGEIGPIVITQEGSIAAGVRRIEALTGEAALDRIADQRRTLDRVARDLRVSWDAIPESVTSLQDRVRSLEKEISRLRDQLAGSQVGDLLDQAIPIGAEGARLLAARVPTDGKNALRQVGDRLRDQLGSGVIVLGAVIDDRPTLLAMVTADLTKRVRAGDLIREIAPIIDGRGGGRPDLAEAGGKDASKLDDALAAVADVVQRSVTGLSSS